MKKAAKQYLGVVVHKWVRLSVSGKVLPQLAQALKPGLFSILSVLDSRQLQIALLDENAAGKTLLKEILHEHKVTYKYDGTA